LASSAYPQVEKLGRTDTLPESISGEGEGWGVTEGRENCSMETGTHFHRTLAHISSTEE